MRFLADMGISTQIVAWLNQSGHDAIHLSDEGLQRLPDHLVFEKARKEKRILLTFDLDFGEIAAASGSSKTSVVVFRMKNKRGQNVIERLDAVLQQVSTQLKEGAIICVEETRYRIRRLPIGDV